MKTLLITHPDCMKHARPRHPERPDRLEAVIDMLEKTGLVADMKLIQAIEISHEQLELIHPSDYITHIERAEHPDAIVQIDPDTYMSPGSTRAAKLAAGAVVGATQTILRGDATKAFCAIRPPGHHAEVAEAFGFCLFNNVALGAQEALRHPDIERVAICDFDVHHCNGTVDIFKDDPRVLVCSSFQNNFYPYRYLDFSNEHIISTPLSAGTDGTQFRDQIESNWLPAIQRLKPDLLFVSAGFDAHKKDPLGELNWTEDDFRWITKLIIDLSNSYSEGRIVSTLEGGYDLEALASSAQVHIEELAQ